jgi:hypothetical protein
MKPGTASEIRPPLITVAGPQQGGLSAPPLPDGAQQLLSAGLFFLRTLVTLKRLTGVSECVAIALHILAHRYHYLTNAGHYYIVPVPSGAPELN